MESCLQRQLSIYDSNHKFEAIYLRILRYERIENDGSETRYFESKRY